MFGQKKEEEEKETANEKKKNEKGLTENYMQVQDMQLKFYNQLAGQTKRPNFQLENSSIDTGDK